MQIPFCGPTYAGRSSNIAASRCVNLYPEVSQEQENQISLVGTPGTRTFASFPLGPVRMSHTVGGRCFVVSGDSLYEVFEDGTVSSTLGTFPNYTGRISVASNGVAASGTGGNQLLMVTENRGYIFNISTLAFAQITDANFPTTPKHVEYLDGYFIVTDGSMGFHVSNLYDGTNGNWGALAFASAAITPDTIQRPFSIHQQLYMIKEFSTAIFYNAGIPTSSGSPFLPVSGAAIDYGTPAPWSVAMGGNTIFFLANQRNKDSGEFAGVVMLSGYTPQIISTPNINYLISRFSTIEDAFGYCYADEGHIFYVLTFPTEDQTFVYDITMGMWHERSTHIPNVKYEDHRHLGDTYTYFAGKHLLGHYSQAALVEMSSGYFNDDGVPIISYRTAPVIFDRHEMENMHITKLVVDAETGVGDGSVDITVAVIADGTYFADGTLTADGRDIFPVLSYNGDPQAWLSWSNDGGHTWSAEYPASMGRMGEYGKRLIWRRLGAPRRRIFKLKMVNSVKKVIIGAYVNNGALPS